MNHNNSLNTRKNQMTNHTLPTGSMTKLPETQPRPKNLPTPDLLALVQYYLPGSDGIGAMYSIVGTLPIRIARIAGMLANAVSSDIRAKSPTLDSYNDVMAELGTAQAAAQAFEQAGFERTDLVQSLTDLHEFNNTCRDYLTSLLPQPTVRKGEKTEPAVRPIDWLTAIEWAGAARPADQWVLDREWKILMQQTGGKPLCTRAQYDAANNAKYGSQKQEWTKHAAAVLNFIELGMSEYGRDFDELDPRTQLSLLNKYSSPAQMEKFTISCTKRAMRAQNGGLGLEADLRLHETFVRECLAATKHPIYAHLIDDRPMVADLSVPSSSRPKRESKRMAETIREELEAKEKRDAGKTSKVKAKSEAKLKVRAKELGDLGEALKEERKAALHDHQVTSLTDMSNDSI